MSERESIYIFDDGSIESKLLQYELKDKYDIQVVGVNIASDIIECFEKIQPDKKVHLHYTYEKYAVDHEKLRRDIQKVEHLGFRNLIVLDYEGLDSVTAYHRAKVAGLKDDIKLTGKPEAIAIVDPDDEMKQIANDVIRDIDKRKPIYNKNSYTDYIPEPDKDEENKPYFTEPTRKRRKFL